MALTVPTDEEILAQAEASHRIDGPEPVEPLARSAQFDVATRKVIVELTSGATFIFPVDLCEGLATRSEAELSDVIVMPGGDGLGWPRLDVHFHLGSLVIGTFGGQRWMKHLRQMLLKQAAGAPSDAKARASRENGQKGGRPRKRHTASSTPASKISTTS
jgi:hypothetical protein